MQVKLLYTSLLFSISSTSDVFVVLLFLRIMITTTTIIAIAAMHPMMIPAIAPPLRDFFYLLFQNSNK